MDRSNPFRFFLRDMLRVGREAATGGMKRGLSEVARHMQSVAPGIGIPAKTSL